MRTWFILTLFCAMGLTSLSANAAPLHKIAIIDAEMEGDLSDASRQASWPYRLESLTRNLREGIATTGSYDVVNLAGAAQVMDRNKGRMAIYNCPPCLKDIATSVGADRIMAPSGISPKQSVDVSANSHHRHDDRTDNHHPQLYLSRR